MTEGKILPQEVLHLVCCNLFVVDCVAEINVEGDLLLFQVVPALIVIRLVEIVSGQFWNIIGFWRDNLPLYIELQTKIFAFSILNFCWKRRGEVPGCTGFIAGVCKNAAPCQAQLFRHIFIQRYPFLSSTVTFKNMVLQTNCREKFRLTWTIWGIVVVPPMDNLGQCFSFAFDRFKR